MSTYEDDYWPLLCCVCNSVIGNGADPYADPSCPVCDAAADRVEYGTCFLCDGSHAIEGCPHYEKRDREMMLLGATLFANLILGRTDYQHELLPRLEDQLGLAAHPEGE